MPFTTAALDAMLDQIGATATHASLHTADPGSTGASEVSGGSYVRQALTWQDAASGIKTVSGTVVFQVPAGTTITYFGLWTAASGGSFEGGDLLDDTPAPFVVGAPYILSLSAVSNDAVAVADDDPRLSDERTPSDNSVTSAKIVAGAIVDSDINASAAIANTKLATNPLARANHTGSQTASTVSDFDTQVATTAALKTRSITAGTGLTGGGDLTADRTLTVAYGTSSTTACVGNDARLSDTRTPTDNTVTSAKIVDGAIVNADINASAAIVLSKLAVDPLARANHTGTQTASTISDFNTAVATTAYLATGGTVTGELDVTARALGLVTPRNHGLIAWSYDPAVATNGASVTNGTVYLIGLQVNRSLTATKIYWGLNSAGVSPVSTQSWVGLYNSAGTRLATVDVTAKVTSATLQTDTISQAVTPGLYWIGMVFNAATPPQPFRAGGLDASLINVGLTASTARYATNGTSQTTLPSSITPASNSTHNIAWWAGLG